MISNKSNFRRFLSQPYTTRLTHRNKQLRRWRNWRYNHYYNIWEIARNPRSETHIQNPFETPCNGKRKKRRSFCQFSRQNCPPARKISEVICNKSSFWWFLSQPYTTRSTHRNKQLRRWRNWRTLLKHPVTGEKEKKTSWLQDPLTHPARRYTPSLDPHMTHMVHPTPAR